jgi:hypothetical protein
MTAWRWEPSARFTAYIETTSLEYQKKAKEALKSVVRRPLYNLESFHSFTRSVADFMDHHADPFQTLKPFGVTNAGTPLRIFTVGPWRGIFLIFASENTCRANSMWQASIWERFTGSVEDPFKGLLP